MAIEPLEKALLLAEGMEQRRALDVMVLHMEELMTVTDYFVICHGRSQTHVDAIAESLEEWAEQHGLRRVILDYGSVVAHIFTEEAREFYDLERLWGDAPVVEHVAEA